jgi:hypothetical protein
MKQSIGFILIMAGIIAMGGSANDCDGACMDQANTLGEMLMVAGVGALMAIVGSWMVITGEEQ